MADTYDEALRELASRIGYEFRDRRLLEQAVRHPSFTHENPGRGEHNQRLEFLGDAVIGLVVAEALLTAFPEAREGDLTRYRAALVSERSLAESARRVELGAVLVVGRGEEAQGGRDRPSVLADGLEAVVGAAFLDGGLEAARQVVATLLEGRTAHADLEAQADHKSVLQERLQSAGKGGPDYTVVAESGPDHAKRFDVELRLGGLVVGRGFGTSKKVAEQEAARDALSRLDNGDEP